MKNLCAVIFILLALTLWLFSASTPQLPTGPTHTNSLGMRLVRVEAQSFAMGEGNTPLPDQLIRPLSYPALEEMERRFPHGNRENYTLDLSHVRNGDFDEKPVHRVKITRPFYIAAHEVTNAQYERFDPSHRALRGKRGFSREDDEAVVFVNWKQAKAFTEWLSKFEGLPYRLPSEAEWELACRAGTTTPFFTGQTLPEAFQKNQRRTSFRDEDKDRVSLKVGQTPPNPWGLFDMHGNVEEWVEDWYGPYEEGEQIDPVGRVSGDFKVTRGGSHGTESYYLRSANRGGTVPEDSHWLIGFRVVLGERPTGKPLPALAPQRHQLDVRQQAPARRQADAKKPYFKGPRTYVKIAARPGAPPFAHHNHDAGITETPNGDLLAIWYTCVEERGREVAVAASRLRYGAEEWEPASTFWDAPDRNDHCPAIWNNGRGTIYHFNGLSVAGTWEPLAIVMRKSTDNGVSWSPARIIVPEHGYRQMVGQPVFRAQDDSIVFAADAAGSALWISRDEGQTWFDPGGTMAGIHAGVTQLSDGRLFAIGRGADVGGMSPMSISSDMGKTWTVSASPFPPISGGQRPVLMRLKEGALFYASFARDPFNPQPATREERNQTRLFAAVSFDDGKTWPVRRVITAGPEDRQVETIDGGPALMNGGASESLGYLAGTQASDGVIHLISSRQHYAFNLSWLRAAAPAPDPRPRARPLPIRGRLACAAPAAEAILRAGEWQFTGTGAPLAANATKGTLALKASAAGQLPRWSNERLNGFNRLDAKRGFSAEIALRVGKAAGAERGVDFEVFARGGTLTVSHYQISITGTAVYYWHDNRFVPIAEGLDNTDLHAFRLAVRPDTAVQVYRDGKLLAVHAPDVRIDWRTPARGSYIEWGAGASEVTAEVAHIAYDLAGAWAPGQTGRKQ